MSSYLSFYIVPKRKNDKEEKKHIIIASYSRSSEIYQRFYENLGVAYIADEQKYTTLSKEDIYRVKSDLKEDIEKTVKRYTEFERYAKDNPDYINEIIELKEYAEDLEYWKAKISFLQDIVEEAGMYSSGVEEVCCNID
jgi:lipopolysaccharide export LptBFGC system permease protein LptF